MTGSNRMRLGAALLLCACLPALTPAAAHAQDAVQTAEPIVTAGDGDADLSVADSPAQSTMSGDDADAARTTYTPDFFAVFQPNTAGDMIAQVPGFNLSSGDGGSRGFGEATANILINGRRPSTKSQSARDLLARIPADTVVRIEILDGASLDIPGLSGQVANVVARAVDLSGRWRYAARFEEGTAPQLLEGSVDISGNRGDLAFSLSANSGQFTFSEDGTEQFFDGNGVLVEDRQEFLQFENRRPVLSLNLAYTPDNDHVVNLNGRIQSQNRTSTVREVFTAIDPDRVSGESFGDGGEDEIEWELGADWSFPAGPGTLKFIGLMRREDSDFPTVFVNAPNGQNPVRSAFLREELEGETIGRTEYNFKIGEAHDIQVSGEYAFNFLESDTRFESNFVEPVLDSVRVEEDRFQGRVTDSWQVSEEVSLQISAGAEYSTLGVVGPGQESRSFFRPKGFVAGSWTASPTYTLRGRVERGVGQLNFGTFVSTRGLIDDRINSGNDDIVPSQFWEGSLELQRVDPVYLSGAVKPFVRLIEDPIDRILFPDGTDGPGNLDSALRYGVEANATLLMDALGVPGLRFEAEGGLFDSRIDDPLTGERRPVSRNVEYVYELEARYDVPGTQIALTAELENDQLSPLFLFDEVQDIVVDAPFFELGIIHKDLLGMQVEVRLQNILNNSITRERLRFQTEDRRLGDLTLIERFARDRGRRLSIVLSDTF